MTAVSMGAFSTHVHHLSSCSHSCRLSIHPSPGKSLCGTVSACPSQTAPGQCTRAHYARVSATVWQAEAHDTDYLFTGNACNIRCGAYRHAILPKAHDRHRQDQQISCMQHSQEAPGHDHSMTRCTAACRPDPEQAPAPQSMGRSLAPAPCHPEQCQKTLSMGECNLAAFDADRASLQ